MKEELLILLDEAYIREEYKETWFKDNQPNSSFIPYIDATSWEEAVREPACGRNPIAGHTQHLMKSLEAAAKTIRGGPWEMDWEASWVLPSPFAAEEWEAMRARIRAVYADVRQAIVDNFSESDTFMRLATMGLLSHPAYHLGSVRQMAYPRSGS